MSLASALILSLTLPLVAATSTTSPKTLETDVTPSPKEATKSSVTSGESGQSDQGKAVAQAVEAMQKFYEGTERFQADFHQTYTYTTFARKTASKGQLKFLKSGSAMRWDYTSPSEKSFVVAAKRYFVYDKEAKQILVAQMESDRISASLSFLWGQGRIDRDFLVVAADASELGMGDGVALELTPKVPDPRFQKVYFLLDRENFSVRESLVVDPDGSENHMVFSNVRTDGTFGSEAFLLNPPQDVQVLRFDQAPAQDDSAAKDDSEKMPSSDREQSTPGKIQK